MNTTLPPIEELLRMPSPCPSPLGIAFDGSRLWLASGEVDRIYAVEPRDASVSEESAVPGTPYGLTVVGDELRAVVGDEVEDDRSIARYVVGHGFKRDMLPCPNATGSWLAYDGDFLYLAQRFEKQILALDDAGAVRRAIPVAREITGMTIVDGCFYLLTTESKEVDDYRLVRLDARKTEPVETEIASLAFIPRGLAYDGTRFWTNMRSENITLAFAFPK